MRLTGGDLVCHFVCFLMLKVKQTQTGSWPSAVPFGLRGERGDNGGESDERSSGNTEMGFSIMSLPVKELKKKIDYMYK